MGASNRPGLQVRLEVKAEDRSVNIVAVAASENLSRRHPDRLATMIFDMTRSGSQDGDFRQYLCAFCSRRK